MSASDETLYEMMLRVENKDIFVDLKKNRGGVYLKISERNGAGRNTVLIPSSGIPRLRAVLDDALKASFKAKSVSRERRNRVAGDPDITSRSVYVTGLTWDTNEAELAQYFTQAGPVVSSVILRQRRGNNPRSSMGCGIVEFGSSEMAQHAVNLLNETELKGRKIRCREDRVPSEEGDDEVEAAVAAVGGLSVASTSKLVRSKRPGDEDKVVEPNKVFVGSLTWDTTEDDLMERFGVVGAVTAVEILSTKKGRSIGSAIVEFADAASVPQAIAQLNNQDLKGRVISVRQYFQ